jgi:hypothetical protein
VQFLKRKKGRREKRKEKKIAVVKGKSEEARKETENPLT